MNFRCANVWLLHTERFCNTSVNRTQVVYMSLTYEWLVFQATILHYKDILDREQPERITFVTNMFFNIEVCQDCNAMVEGVLVSQTEF